MITGPCAGAFWNISHALPMGGRELAEHVVVPELPGRSQVIAGTHETRKCQVRLGRRADPLFYGGRGPGICRNGTLRGLSSRILCGLLPQRSGSDPGRMLEDLERATRDMGIVKEQSFPSDKNAEYFCQQRHGSRNGPIRPKQGLSSDPDPGTFIFRAFDTYIRSMREHGEVYSREETAAIIRKYIDWLKQGGTVAGTS